MKKHYIFYMYRTLCDLDSVRDQEDGEPQRVAEAE